MGGKVESGRQIDERLLLVRNDEEDVPPTLAHDAPTDRIAHCKLAARPITLKTQTLRKGPSPVELTVIRLRKLHLGCSPGEGMLQPVEVCMPAPKHGVGNLVFRTGAFEPQHIGEGEQAALGCRGEPVAHAAHLEPMGWFEDVHGAGHIGRTVAIAVEMEGIPIAAHAAAEGAPFVSLRVVLDPAAVSLGESDGLIDVQTGDVKPLAVARSLFTGKSSWASLRSMQKMQSTAEARLQRLFAAYLTSR